MPRRDYSGFYEELGVSPGATAQEIKAAYRRLVKQVHPDVSKGPDSEAKFQQLRDAYDVLSNTARRLEYDVASGAMDEQAHREAQQASVSGSEAGGQGVDGGGRLIQGRSRWAAVSVAGLATLLIVASGAGIWAWRDCFINLDQMFTAAPRRRNRLPASRQLHRPIAADTCHRP
ncbi:MAG: J domain-containing protein [Devosia sp.]|nr:J domain-containing protein [Devosia sp.]